MYKILIYAVDIVLVLFSIFLTFMVRYDFNPPSFNYVAFSNIAPFIVLVYIVFMLIFGLGDILKQSVEEIFISVFLTVLSLMITTSFISFFARQFSYPRSVLLISSVIQFVFLAAWRVIAWKINRLKHGIKDSLVVGEEAAEYVKKDTHEAT
jgi:FlaA1/EpsC-like NDP-sugar epimerase